MKFWTILVVTYGTGYFDGEKSLLAYPSIEACNEMMLPVFDSLQPTFPDVMVQCVESDQLSNPIRPKPRPPQPDNLRR